MKPVTSSAQPLGRHFTFFVLGLVLAGCKTVAASAENAKSAEANQSAATVSNATAPSPRALPVLFLVGDSTVHNTGRGLKGWGDVISPYFDTNRIKVENHARGGRSSRTFQTQGWWSNVLAAAKPGDFVMIQLGHNDGGALDDTNRARGTLRGLGEESKEIYNPITHAQEIVHTYGWYLRKYVTDACAKGLTPILCSPVPRVPRQTVQADTVDTNSYVAWSRAVARSENAFFIDLNHLVMRHCVSMTPEEIKAEYFTPADNTHTSPAGAELNAAVVVEGLRALKDCPLNAYLTDRPEIVAPAADSAKP